MSFKNLFVFPMIVRKAKVLKHELICICSIKREVMDVVSIDPNMIFIVGDCDIEDHFTKQDVLDDI
jgi:hypothetical protein